MTDQITVDPADAELVPLAGGNALATVGGGVLATQPHGKPHPEPRQYVLIAVILVVITGFEIATSYLDTAHTNLIIAALGVMAAVKFFLVVAWFMHLRTDNKILRRFFLTGLCAAPLLYLVVLLMLHFARY